MRHPLVMERLPIDDVLPELIAQLRSAGRVVLRAATGAGKTTRVPPAFLQANLLGTGRLLLLEPRRVAARAAARRMALEHGSPLGSTFGYQVRFDSRCGPNTRVLAVTPGILLRQLHDDPFLDNISTIVFDEFHERGLEADLALGMVKLLRQTVRPDLRVVVMSATLDPEPLAAYLDGSPVVISDGRTFPVLVRYQNRPIQESPVEAAARAVRLLLSETPGDLLVFLPGLGEIRRLSESLADLEDLGIAVLPLHGDLPPEQQDRALQKLDRRKVVLATNVAETSVTVEGITAVIDTGLARQMEFDAALGMDRLQLVPISRASADQRAGRAGRTQAGVCLRLWDEPSHRARREQTEPEIRRVDLASALLQLLNFGEEVSRFPWFDAPRPDAVDQGRQLLQLLGAMNAVQLTDVGRTMAGLPVHPRVGRLLIEGVEQGAPERAALAAALLSERDPFVREIRDSGPRTASVASSSDVLDRVEALEEFERSSRLASSLGELHRGGARQVLHARDQLLRLIRPLREHLESPETEEALLRAIAAAYPDRLVKRRGPGESRGKMLGGRGVRLAPQSAVRDPELFVAVEVDAGGTDSFVRQASMLKPDWLPRSQVIVENVVIFDANSERIVARKQTRFADLVLEETQGHIADETQAAQVLAEAARHRWEKAAPAPDSPAGLFRTRVRCLRGWMPELELPAFDDAELQALLPEVCRGLRSLTEVRIGPWLDQMRGTMSYALWQRIEREAPERIEVPTGSQIALEYSEGRLPVLAVRIQELFGLIETPRIADGRVPVLLHLLAPNYRPQQVTGDLASFWANGYPLVRKELRARYPKHSWPEDPLTAEPIRGPRKRLN